MCLSLYYQICSYGSVLHSCLEHLFQRLHHVFKFTLKLDFILCLVACYLTNMVIDYENTS